MTKRKSKWIVYLQWLVLIFAIAPLLPAVVLYHLTKPIPAQTLAGMAAKVSCSAHFISGYSPDKTIDDLAGYGFIFRWLNIQFDQHNKQVTASIPGITYSVARFNSATGCTLTVGKQPSVSQVTVTRPVQSNALWPAGNQVSPNPTFQRLLKQQLQDDNEQGHDTRALVVIDQGQLVAEAYAPGIAWNTPLLGWSMGKSFSALLIGHLVKTQQLDLFHTPVFPEWQDTPRSHITLEHLLHMSSGLDFVENYMPGASASEMLFASPTPTVLPLRAEVTASAGTQFRYSSGTTNLLNRLVFQTTGSSAQALNDFLYYQILFPLGMFHTIAELSPSGVFLGSSFMFASARDWARLGELMANNGQLNGIQLVSPQWLKRTVAPNTADNEKGFGYHVWLNQQQTKLRWPSLPADAFAFKGDKQQIVMVIPSQHKVIVRLGWSNKKYPVDHIFSRLLQTL